MPQEVMRPLRMSVLSWKGKEWDFPGGLVVKAPCLHCSWLGFIPWLGN